MKKNLPSHGSEISRDVPESWPVEASRVIHRDDWIMGLREDSVVAPRQESSENGETSETLPRLVLEHPGAVVVLAIDEQERVRCLRQYRHPAARRFLELPAGLCDGGPDEAPLETAKRELREEVELEASHWQPLLKTWPTPGISTEVHWFFLARGLSHCDRGEFELHGEEAAFDHLWCSVDELLDGILSGEICNGPVVQAVLTYRAMRERGELIG